MWFCGFTKSSSEIIRYNFFFSFFAPLNWKYMHLCWWFLSIVFSFVKYYRVFALLGELQNVVNSCVDVIIVPFYSKNKLNNKINKIRKFFCKKMKIKLN